MTIEDKIMLWVGMIFAFTGFFSPVMGVPYLHWVLVICTAVSFVLCMAVLLRGAFPRLRGK